jgi:hypothetical protein
LRTWINLLNELVDLNPGRASAMQIQNLERTKLGTRKHKTRQTMLNERQRGQSGVASAITISGQEANTQTAVESQRRLQTERT